MLQLAETELFKGISPEGVQKMLKCMRVHIIDYKKNETVCHYGGGSNRIGIVLSGRAAILRTDYNGYESLLENLPEGAIFSEAMSYAKTAGDSILVKCAVRSKIAYLNYDKIRYFRADECQVSYGEGELLRQNLISMLISRAKLLSERVEVLGCHSMREKLLCYFRLRLAGKETGRFELPFTWLELASYINSDRSAMMREIAKMTEEGLITTDRHTVKVLKKFGEQKLS